MYILTGFVNILLWISPTPAVSNQFNNNQRTLGNQRSSIEHSSKLVTQSFQREPDYLEINPGANALMECRVFGKSRSSLCIWQKDGKPVRMQQDGKYEWYGGPEHGDCSLKILKADINYDDGKVLYACIYIYIMPIYK